MQPEASQNVGGSEPVDRVWGDELGEIEDRLDDPDFLQELLNKMRKRDKKETIEGKAGGERLLAKILKRLGKGLMAPFKLANAAVKLAGGVASKGMAFVLKEKQQGQGKKGGSPQEQFELALVMAICGAVRKEIEEKQQEEKRGNQVEERPVTPPEITPDNRA